MNNKTIEVDNESKLMFPKDGITKKNVIEYYERIFEYMLPHIKDRPISMHRFPDGIDNKGFYQKNVSDYFPKWLKTERINKEDGYNTQVVIEKKEDLVFLADQATITIHTWLSKIDEIDKPDKFIFDLDPPETLDINKGFELVKFGANKLKEIFDEMNMESFVMTTGSKGLHVGCFIQRERTFDEVRDFTEEIAEKLVRDYPNKFTTEIRKNKRKGRLFLDTLRNAYAQTGVAPYTLRAKLGAPVATPIEWDELPNIKNAQEYNIRNIFRRLGQKDHLISSTL